MKLSILPNNLLETYIQEIDFELLKSYKNLEESELSINEFSFYTSVSAVFSSKIEGEEMVESRFRWDFLLYSFSAIAIAYYYIIKRRFKDSFYDTLFGIYAIGNAFWILVIRANFTNRFAYLSWFLLPAIIIYPLLKVKFFEGQYRIISIMIFLFYLFTYFMYIITM